MRDRRASVLGVQLFGSPLQLSAGPPPTSEVSTTVTSPVAGKPFSVSSEDAEQDMGKPLRHMQHQESDDVMEMSGTFEMMSPLQRRVSDTNTDSVTKTRCDMLSSFIPSVCFVCLYVYLFVCLSVCEHE